MPTKVWQNDNVTIKVNYELCTGHGSCAENCPGEVYDIISNQSVAARIDDCVECCTCVEVCPDKAIAHSSC
jgi:NAD-dependent dihydropyrimidine dehydrogenase PreA subunit